MTVVESRDAPCWTHGDGSPPGARYPSHGTSFGTWVTTLDTYYVQVRDPGRTSRRGQVVCPSRAPRPGGGESWSLPHLRPGPDQNRGLSKSPDSTGLRHDFKDPVGRGVPSRLPGRTGPRVRHLCAPFSPTPSVSSPDPCDWRHSPVKRRPDPSFPWVVRLGRTLPPRPAESVLVRVPFQPPVPRSRRPTPEVSATSAEDLVSTHSGTAGGGRVSDWKLCKCESVPGALGTFPQTSEVGVGRLGGRPGSDSGGSPKRGSRDDDNTRGYRTSCVCQLTPPRWTLRGEGG